MRCASFVARCVVSLGCLRCCLLFAVCVFICWLMFVVCGVLFDAVCWSHGVCCALFLVCCLLCVFSVACLLFVVFMSVVVC